MSLLSEPWRAWLQRRPPSLGLSAIVRPEFLGRADGRYWWAHTGTGEGGWAPDRLAAWAEVDRRMGR